MGFTPEVIRRAREVADRTHAERIRATTLLLNGGYPAMDPETDRLADSLASAVGVEFGIAKAISRGQPLDALGLSPAVRNAVRKFLGIDNSEPLEFAAKALRVARAVGRLAPRGGSGAGTCFMISPHLLATAGHVLPDCATVHDLVAEFNFEAGSCHSEIHARFALAPEKLFVSEQQLGIDAAIVALGESMDSASFKPAFCSLSDNGSAHPTGYHANIIHHPGEFPQIVVRDNWLLPSTKEMLVYRTQAEEGSSGAPVFNFTWDLIAVHWFGETRGHIPVGKEISIPDEVNQGVRAIAIYKALRKLTDLTPKQQALIDEAAPGK
jgi:endonuclease G, mitochondrial